jgi:fibronectin-binding autotransporter adhesin
MSARNGFVLLVALSALMFLAACGGGSSGIAAPVAPSSGSFSNSSLNGTYVFAVSGLDSSGDAYSMAGTFTANGNGGITGGALDLNDPAELTSGPAADASINSGSTYTVTVDGRGQTQITTNITGLPSLNLDFVLSSSSSGLVSEIDSFGTGTGTLDAQTGSVTPSGAYAFSLSGAYGSGTLAAVGNFAVGSGGTISSGLADFNDNGVTVSTAETLTGGVVVSSSGPSSTLNTSSYPNLTFDVFPVSATHLKLIEMDATAVLLGDAYSQTSATMPTGTLPFTLVGSASGNPFAAGGFLVTDGSGNITSSSSEDFNDAGTLSPSGSVSFSGTYAETPASSGRFALGLASFTGGENYVAYPSSGGTLLMDIDSAAGIVTTGAAYGPQSSTASLNTGAGYGLNLAGVNFTEEAYVYDTGEFATASGGGTISSGAIDEGFFGPNIGPGSSYGVPLTGGTYTSPSGGRGEVTATASSSNGANSTLEGGLTLIYYTVDGTTFPFIEYDSGQTSAGIFVLQNPSSSSASVAKSESLFVPRLPLRPSVKKKAR